VQHQFVNEHAAERNKYQIQLISICCHLPINEIRHNKLKHHLKFSWLPLLCNCVTRLNVLNIFSIACNNISWGRRKNIDFIVIFFHWQRYCIISHVLCNHAAAIRQSSQVLLNKMSMSFIHLLSEPLSRFSNELNNITSIQCFHGNLCVLMIYMLARSVWYPTMLVPSDVQAWCCSLRVKSSIVCFQWLGLSIEKLTQDGTCIQERYKFWIQIFRHTVSIFYLSWMPLFFAIIMCAFLVTVRTKLSSPH